MPPTLPETYKGFWAHAGFNSKFLFVSDHMREKFSQIRGGHPDPDNRNISELLSGCVFDFRSPENTLTNTRWRSKVWVPPVPGQMYDHLCFTVVDLEEYSVLKDIESHDNHPYFQIEEFVIDDFFGASLHVTSRAIEQFIESWPQWPHVPKKMGEVRGVMRDRARRSVPSPQSSEHFDVIGNLRFLATELEDGKRVLVGVERIGVADKKTPHKIRKQSCSLPTFELVGFTIEDFYGKPLYVTEHAITRFIEWWPEKLQSPKSMGRIRREIKRLARNASPSEKSTYFAERSIKHDFELTEYFDVFRHLRFVVVTKQESGDRVLVTVERRKGAPK